MPAQHPPKKSMEDHDVLPPPEAPVCQKKNHQVMENRNGETPHTHLYIRYVPVYSVYIYRYLCKYIHIYIMHKFIFVYIYIYICKGSMFHPTMLQETGTFCFWYLHLKPKCVEIWWNTSLNSSWYICAYQTLLFCRLNEMHVSKITQCPRNLP